MKRKIAFLIDALNNTDTYERENALINLYIFLKSQKCSLPKAENTAVFVEISRWRDYSLRDGVESYYEEKGVDELAHLEGIMKIHVCFEVCKKYITGIHSNKEESFIALDNWIYKSEWEINDFLVALTDSK